MPNNNDLVRQLFGSS